ncbi:putative protein N(5)-glutamine methyltransferase [Nocardia sp. 004]|uniref:putative protein N(5)-glutamine methyltransferase n=1 Tax=Nocardia sp. 004 TaxID=3385978 RepID=UPI0039A04760
MTTTDPTAVIAQLRAAGCVFAEDEARLLTAAAARTGTAVEVLVAQRVTGTPLEHLLGWAEFHQLRVTVTPGVFVPRQRTTFLVDRAIELIRAGTGHRIVDLCCGSGAVGMAVTTIATAEGHAVTLTAADIDPVAVACARRNLGPLGATVYTGDLFEPLPEELSGHIDILLCNAPYVPSAMIERMPPEARDHEPRAALDGGDDGLDIIRRVTADAIAWLAPGGHLLVETSRRQSPLVLARMIDHGLISRVAESDDRDATVVIGTRPQ